VDDEDTVRTISARMLKAIGFTPLLAIHGREALDLYAVHSGEIVAVLLDLTMPVLDGPATLTELRRLRADLPVLLMSGFTEHDALDRFAGKGLSGFLQKPFKTEDLRNALRAIFAAK
jgi:CheY-like chemotaxis protein